MEAGLDLEERLLDGLQLGGVPLPVRDPLDLQHDSCDSLHNSLVTAYLQHEGGERGHQPQELGALHALQPPRYQLLARVELSHDLVAFLLL